MLRFITRLVLLLVFGVLASGVVNARIQDRVWPPAASAEKLASWGGHPETAVLRQAATMQAAETQQAASSLGYDFASERLLAAENIPQAFGTPYRQLSKKAYSRLQGKVANRTITREEWSRLRWNERLTDRRQAGIDGFWDQERQNLTRGLAGSRNWSAEAREAILSGGQPRGIFSHHSYSVSQYPQLANVPAHIKPVTYFEHFFKWHGGSWRNPSHGVPLRPDLPDSF